MRIHGKCFHKEAISIPFLIAKSVADPEGVQVVCSNPPPHHWRIFQVIYAPAMTMAGALSVNPVRPSVRTYLRTYVRTSVQTTSAL